MILLKLKRLREISTYTVIPFSFNCIEINIGNYFISRTYVVLFLSKASDEFFVFTLSTMKLQNIDHIEKLPF